jgi:hypothetical protein
MAGQYRPVDTAQSFPPLGGTSFYVATAFHF